MVKFHCIIFVLQMGFEPIFLVLETIVITIILLKLLRSGADLNHRTGACGAVPNRTRAPDLFY